MKKYNLIKNQAFVLIALMVMVVSCKVEDKASFKDEQAKDIAGTWKVVAATRNGSDLLALAPTEISQFAINFESNNKFTLTNPIPFLALEGGSYSFDDPITPFSITLTEDSGSTSSTAFNYPIINGKRQIQLTFSPGCELNKYIYTLEKAD